MRNYDFYFNGMFDPVDDGPELRGWSENGQGLYFVVRTAGEFCNDTGSWTSGGPAESPDRDPSLP